MSIYTLIAGVDGVGKSSLAGLLLAQTNTLGRFIDTDRLVAELGIGRVSAGKVALQQIQRCLDWKLSFTQETTLAGRQPRETARKAKQADFQVFLHNVALDSLTESLQRIENRVRLGGHSIPEKDVTRRFQKRFSDLIALLPWCDETKLYDNRNGFQLVAIWRNGILIPQGNYTPQWLSELEQSLKNNNIL
ncbi:MAG: hypothetical protein Q4C70_14185 [Planctomycetia bacterium]|nr:hypothetical protein [Planctomycetia bacterium]